MRIVRGLSRIRLLSAAGYVLFLALAVILLLEIITRLYFSTQVGPRIFFYGTNWQRNAATTDREAEVTATYSTELAVWDANNAALADVSEHHNRRGGYFKYYPNETKYIKDIDSGEIFPVTINSQGFRGEEFTVAKPENTVRVLTLGASSTFGFTNRDNETYPVILEAYLNERCARGPGYEVVNFAIPHATAENIRNMVIAEGLALDPDVMTFYEGRNDSYRIHPTDFRKPSEREETEGRGVAFWQAAIGRSLFLRTIDEVVLPDAAGAPVDVEGLAAASKHASKAFMDDLEQLRNLATSRDVLLIIANQQANSQSWFGIPAGKRQGLRGVTYGEEVDAIRSRIRHGETISGYEFNFLVHARLMRDLEAWANAGGLPFVDVIGLLDMQRHHMVSWVHLDRHANELVAAALAEPILAATCSS